MSDSPKPKRRPSLLWPLLLIAVGATLLLSNLGLLPPDFMSVLWRFWPLVLVIIGLDILFGRRSAIGAILVSAVAIVLIGGALTAAVFVQSTPDLVSEIDLGQLRQSTITAPRGEIETADIFIDWSKGPATLYALSDSNNLIEGDLTYYGTLEFVFEEQGTHANVAVDARRDQFLVTMGEGSSGQEEWQIGLHPQVKLALSVDAGSGSGNYDLRQLSIGSLEIDAGSGPLSIMLPESGRVTGAIDGGSGSMKLTLPEGMEARFVVDKGSGNFSADERFTRQSMDKDSVWVTDNFANADNYIELMIDQGSGNISVK